MIKPDFWTDEVIGRLSRDARLAYIASWNFADDEGRLRGTLPYLQGQIFPYDEDVDFKAIYDELLNSGRWVPYSVNNQKYILLPKLKTHQRIDRPQPSSIPAPPDLEISPDHSTNDSSSNSSNGSSSHSRPIEYNIREEKRSTSATGVAPPEVPRKAKKEDKIKIEDQSFIPDFTPSMLKELWNSTADPSFPRCMALAGKRASSAAARIKEHPDPDFWRDVILRINRIDFCHGKNDRGWVADFDFLVKPETWVKVLEGKYDRKNNGAGSVGDENISHEELESMHDEEHKRLVRETIENERKPKL